jgi:hypothetical protein
MKSGKSLRRVCAVLVVVSVAIAAALVGGASTGRAAPGVTVDLVPLIATSSDIVSEIPQVSYGGKIGYHLTITNAGTSTTPQTSSITVTSPNATYVDSVATFNDVLTLCGAQSGSNGHVMVCTLPTGTLRPGDTFEADLRFQATTSTTVAQVVTRAAVSVAAKTVGGKNSNGNTLSFDDVTTALVAGGDKSDEYLRVGETGKTSGFSSTHRQNFGVTLPDTSLLGDPFGVALSIHDNVGTPLCTTGCLPSWTTLTIPAASFATKDGNPFYDGTTVNAYSWSMTARYPSGYKFTAVIHFDANGPHTLPTCGVPTAEEPMCYDADSLDITHGNTPTISVTGKGIANGNITFG